jgi:hypothetical protein
VVDGLPPAVRHSYPHTDCAAVARAAGAHGIRAEQPGNVREALREAFSHNVPALVDAVTAPHAPATLPRITTEQVTGFSLSASRTVLRGGVGSWSNSPAATSATSPAPEYPTRRSRRTPRFCQVSGGTFKDGRQETSRGCQSPRRRDQSAWLPTARTASTTVATQVPSKIDP